MEERAIEQEIQEMEAISIYEVNDIEYFNINVFLKS